ncbi:hypothetical protein DID88_006179 [Monilinia fructigena]|uniref:Aminoglycoside phosphotransferase domain-containing protein n=1 Tax=Monilinia fructigena TaxID=38457 RepID=A0A395J730_9HELO|nr:hypothetical protein DID88_006179 [Monilinia fructigena]
MDNPADETKPSSHTREPSPTSEQSIFDTEDIIYRDEFHCVTHEFATKMFRKTSRHTQYINVPDSPPRVLKRSFNHERIINEVNALKLVSEHTTIPVPRLLDHGINPDGTRYLVTELITGIPLTNVLGAGCLQVFGQKHRGSTKELCTTCERTAYSIAVKFIDEIVLTQLSNMKKSHERGIDGFVMPPVWLPIDRISPWKEKECRLSTRPLDTSGYVFMHGDLAEHNILIDVRTFQVCRLADWEYAGYFPAGMDRWPEVLDRIVYDHAADDLAGLIEEYLAEDCLEACDQLEDREELYVLIKSGLIPCPERLRESIAMKVS